MNKNQNEEEEKKPIKSRLQDLKDQLIKPDDITSFDEFTIDKITDDDNFVRPLEPRQLSFITEYLKDFNGTQAAIRAGYSEKTANVIASNLLTKVNVKQEISRRQALIQEASNITREKVIHKLLELIEDCYTDEKTDRTSILKAMDMINKITGIYTPENQINILNQGDSEIKITIVKPS